MDSLSILHGQVNQSSNYSPTMHGRRYRLFRCNTNKGRETSLWADGLSRRRYHSMKRDSERLLGHSRGKFLLMVIIKLDLIIHQTASSLFCRLFHPASQRCLWSNGRQWFRSWYMGQSQSIRKDSQCIGSSTMHQQYGTHRICQRPSCMGCDSWSSSYQPHIFISDRTHAMGSCWAWKCHNLSTYRLRRFIYRDICGRRRKSLGVPVWAPGKYHGIYWFLLEGQLSPRSSLRHIWIWFRAHSYATRW